MFRTQDFRFLEEQLRDSVPTENDEVEVGKILMFEIAGNAKKLCFEMSSNELHGQMFVAPSEIYVKREHP